MEPEDVEAINPQEDLFAADDKALRKRILAQKKEIRDAIAPSAPDEFRKAMNDLLGALQGHDLATASRMLAQRHNLPEGAAGELVRGLGLVHLNAYAFFGDDPKDVADRARLLGKIDQALDQADRHPLMVQLAAFTLFKANFCDEGLLTLGGSGADRPALLRSVAAVTTCPAPLLEATRLDPARRHADLALLHSFVKDQPALTLWLLRPELQQAVAPEGQRAFRIRLTRKAIADAFNMGAEARGLALFDALDAAGQSAMIADTQEAFSATIDGVPIPFAAEEDASLATSLAAALHVAGRTEEARALIARDPALPVQRQLTDCLYRARTAKDDVRALKACARGDAEFDPEPNVDTLRVAWALETPQADPYPIFEVGLSVGSRAGENAPLARFYCAVFAGLAVGDVCADAREAVVRRIEPSRYRDDAEIATEQALTALDLPEWAAITAGLERDRQAALATFDDGTRRESYQDRPPIEPIHPAFAQHALPPELISQRAQDESDGEDSPDWPKGWAALPEGFAPVRWESAGARAAAISQSNFYDHGGEVGSGGYWVHLSDDGGKTWGKPLYTGLAANFPYVIEATSKLPLLKDDRLQIEVTYALLDTSSITYPPVGLRTLRRERDLWLDVPLAMLSRDSDGDGLTDLAAAHLRIDGPAGEAPLVLGAGQAHCARGEEDPAAVISRRVLMMLTGIDEAAIREPIDRRPDAPLFAGISAPEVGGGWPLFVKGDPADFACMAPVPLPVLVYGPKGEEALQRRSPDFRLIELPAPIMNRDRSRGYVVWSAGWTGGTILFWRERGEWKFTEIERWIT